MQDRVEEEQAAIREAQEFVARQEQEIRNQVARDVTGNVDNVQTANNLKNKINDVEGRARDAQVRIENRQQPEGFSRNFQDGTFRNNLELTRIVTKEVLALYKNHPAYYQSILPLDSVGRRILDQLVSRIENPQAEVNLGESSYVQKIVHAAINNTVNNPLEVLSDGEFEILNLVNRTLYEKVVAALSEAARQVGRSDDEIREFTERERARTERTRQMVADLERSQKRSEGYAGAEMLKKLAPEHPRLLELYDSLSSVEDFNNYYRGRMAELRRGGNQNPAKAASEEIVSDIVHLLNVIERPVLRKSPEESFDKYETESGEFGQTPNYVFQHLLETRLGQLEASASSLKESGELEELEYYEIVRKRDEKYIEDLGQTVLVVPPGAKFERSKEGLATFAEFLKEVIISEREALRYGFNFTYLLKHGPPHGKDESWFKQIAEYADNLKSHHLDMSRALPYSNEIQAMEMIISDMYRKEFGYLGRWRKRVEFMDEFFSRFSVVEKKVIEIMRQKRMPDGTNIPEWVVERSLHQARTKFFGIDFMLNSMAGYMDPATLEGATATYISEGDYYGIFDIWSLGKRFIGSKDPEVGGLMFMPVDQQIGWYDHKKLIDEGRGIWKKMDTEGQSAKFGSKYFEGNLQKDKPYKGVMLEAELGNITEAGGVDTLDSWRNLFQYIQWLQFKGDLEVNPETKGIDFNKPMVLVNSWKRIENLGVSVLRNYIEQLLFGGGGYGAVEKYAVIEDVIPEEFNRYVEFYRFLYRRYFNVEGVGKSFIQKRDETGNITQMNENEFMRNIRGILTKINKENYKIEGRKLRTIAYQALTAAMFERMPLDFILMENKPRITQNGVTMLTEIQKHFKRQLPDADRWSDDQFSHALDDLIFVQQEARVKTLEGMERSLEENNNLYGDLNQDRSTAMDGRAYVVDEEFIRNALQEGNRRDRAIDLYRKIKDVIIQLPSANKTEQNSPEKYGWRKQYYNSRISWWSDALETKLFGFSLTSAEKAQKFLNYSATGPETTKRAANFCANTAETAYKAFVGNFLPACFQAEAERKYESLVSWLYPIKKGVEQEWGEEMAFKVATRFQQMQVYMFRADDRANLPGGAARDWVLDQTSSLMQDFKGPRRNTWLWGKDEIYNLVTENEAKNIIPKNTNPEDKKYRDTTASQQFGVLGKLAETINGGPIYLKDLPSPFKNLARDYGNEFSGEGLRGHNKARLHEAFGLKSLGLALFLLFIYLKEAYEKDQKKG